MNIRKFISSITKNNSLRIIYLIVWMFLTFFLLVWSFPTKTKSEGIIIFLFGLCGLIWYKINAKLIVVSRGFLFQKLSKDEISKRIKQQEIGFILGGVIFGIVGTIMIFS